MARNRLTVVQLLPALNAGGVERGTLEIASALVAAGHRSVVVSTGGRLVEELQAVGSEHITLPVAAKRPGTLLGVSRLRRLFEALDADIVHARSRVPAWLTFLAWRRMPKDTRPKFVTTVHGFYSVNWYSAVMTKGERVIAVSDSIRTYIAENYTVDIAKVITVYRGIDREAYPYGYEPSAAWLDHWQQGMPSRRRLDISQPNAGAGNTRQTKSQVASPGKDVPLIVLPGRLTRLKGHETFINLMAELSRRGVVVQGLIVGGEDAKRLPYARSLYERAEALPVTFTGHRQDLREIMTQAQVVLSLSTQAESFGRTVLEALSIGRPVIGFDHGGVGEILGKLYPEGRLDVASTPGTLADKVERFLVQPPPVLTHTEFALRTMQSRTLALYEELAQGHPS